METNEIIKKIYELSTESKVADERTELQLESTNKRIEALENLSQTMAENLFDMKHLQTIVGTLSNTVHQDTNDIKELKSKYYALEARPTQEKAKKWSYVIDTIFKTLFTAALAFVLCKVGLK